MKPGDKIPAEREFARSLHVSRASLRAGLGHMAAMGIVKMRRGVGTFVAEGPSKLGTHHWASVVCYMNFNFGRLFEARLTLESKLAALAAERAKKEHCLLLANEVTET